MVPRPSESIAGRLATWAGALCAVHCVLTAVGLGVLSAAGFGFLNSPAVEFSVLSVAVLAGSFAIWHGVRRHHSWVPALAFVAGLGLIVASHFGVLGESVWPLAWGGVLIAAFQLLNGRLQHRGCRHATDVSGHAIVSAPEPSRRVEPQPR